MPLTEADVNTLVSKLEGEREDLDRAIKLLKGLRGPASSPSPAAAAPVSPGGGPSPRSKRQRRGPDRHRRRMACQRKGCTTRFLAHRANARYCRPCRRLINIEKCQERRDAAKATPSTSPAIAPKPKPAILVPGDNLSRKGA